MKTFFKLKSFIFVLMFFLPYVLGNLRVEVIIFVLAVPIAIYKLKKVEKLYYPTFRTRLKL